MMTQKTVQVVFKKVNEGLEELNKWFKCNKLTLNLKKTEYIYFGGPRQGYVHPGGLAVGGEQVRRVENARFLGIRVDEGLKWAEHIERVKGKIGQLVGVLGRARAVLQGHQLRTLYNALVLPHLQYCLIVWGDFREGRNAGLGEALLRYQKRLAGLIAGKVGWYHADPIFAAQGILKVDDLYR